MHSPLKHLSYLFITCATFIAPQIDAQIATGFVFHDQNANNIKDSKEPGIPNVLVSNGIQIVKTSIDGSYQIPVKDDTCIFVIKPKSWLPPVNEYNLPQFHYIHKPGGSPQTYKYAGVAPTGPLPDEINFPLTPNDETKPFKVLVFGDPQPETIEEVGFFDRDIVSELHDLQDVAFGLTLGDIVDDDLDLFEPINQSIRKIGIPFYHVYGNHDMNFDAPNDLLADETFERVYGPATFAYNYGDALFIHLDNVIYPQAKKRKYIGGFRSDQMQFLENLLAHTPKDQLIILNMHIPLFLQPNFGETFRVEDRSAFFNILSLYTNTFSMSAHTHSQRHHFFDKDSGWLGAEPHQHFNVGTTSGSWWGGPLDERGIPDAIMHDGTPNGYLFLNIDGSHLTYDYKVANAPADYKMRLYTPAVVRRSDYSSPIIANVFAATENAVLEYRLSHSSTKKWRKMRRTETVDPIYMQKMLERDTSTSPTEGPRLGYPSFSQHLWKGNLPKKQLVDGPNTVEVRYTDIFGREHVQSHEFLVEAD